MDLKKYYDTAQRSVSSSYDQGVDRLLERLGYEQKRNTMDVLLPALGIFGAGLAAGAMMGVLFAPKRGEEIRTDIRHRIGDIRDRGAEQYGEIRNKSQELMENVRPSSES